MVNGIATLARGTEGLRAMGPMAASRPAGDKGAGSGFADLLRPLDRSTDHREPSGSDEAAQGRPGEAEAGPRGTACPAPARRSGDVTAHVDGTNRTDPSQAVDERMATSDGGQTDSDSPPASDERPRSEADAGLPSDQVRATVETDGSMMPGPQGEWMPPCVPARAGGESTLDADGPSGPPSRGVGAPGQGHGVGVLLSVSGDDRLGLGASAEGGSDPTEALGAGLDAEAGRARSAGAGASSPVSPEAATRAALAPRPQTAAPFAGARLPEGDAPLDVRSGEGMPEIAGPEKASIPATPPLSAAANPPGARGSLPRHGTDDQGRNVGREGSELGAAVLAGSEPTRRVLPKPMVDTIASGPAAFSPPMEPGRERNDLATLGLAPVPQNATWATTPGVPPGEGMVARDIGRQIAQAGLAPGGTAELRLAPEELGPLRLSVERSEDGLRLVIEAARPETADLLRRHIEALRQELRQEGLGSVGVSIGGGESRREGGAAPHRNQDGPGLHSSFDATPPRGPAPAFVVAPAPRGRAADGHLDLRF